LPDCWLKDLTVLPRGRLILAYQNPTTTTWACNCYSIQKIAC